MTKRGAIAAVIIVALILAVALASQTDAEIKGVPIKGGTYKTRTVSQWKLYQYKTVTLPKAYPFKYAPWRSYVLIDRYTEVSADASHNLLIIDPKLYATIKPEADANRKTAKAILKKHHVRGKGKPAYNKIRRYVRGGEYITGVKTAAGFFEHHGGDCAAHASAVYVLCKAQGIPVRYCIGAYDSGVGMTCHAWNRVRLGRTWYWVDETMHESMSRKLWKDHRKPMEMW